MNKVMRAPDTVDKLVSEWGIPQAEAERVIRVAVEHGVNVTNSGDMLRVVTVRHLGKDPHTFILTEGTPSQKDSRKKTGVSVPKSGKARYSSGVGNERSLASRASATVGETTKSKESQMPKTAEAEAEVLDLTPYLDKDITPTVADYHEFLEQELGVKVDQRAVYYAVTLYKFFQGSDFNRDRKEARRAEKTAGNGTAEEAEDAPAPKRGRGRPAATKEETEEAPAPKRGRGRPAAAAPAAAPRRRGRPTKATAGEPAPY